MTTVARTFLLAFFALVSTAAAQQTIDPIETARQGVETRQALVAELKVALESADGTTDLVDLRERLRAARSRSDGQLQPVRDALQDARARLDQLGPAPEDGAEAEEITAERERLQKEIVAMDAILRQAAVNQTDFQILLDDIDDRRQAAFYDQVFERGQTPFAPKLLAAAAANAGAGFARAADATTARIAELREAGALSRTLGVVGVAILLAIVLFVPARNWITNRLTRRIEQFDPTPTRRALAAAARTIARVAPGLLGGYIVLEALASQNIVTPALRPAANAAWLSLVAILMTDAFSNAVFSPRLPAWRVLNVETTAAALLKLLAVCAVGVYAADLVLTRFSPLLGGSEDFSRVQSAAVAFAIGAILILASSKALWAAPEADAPETDEKKNETRGSHLRFAALVAGVTMIIAAAVGYVSLAYYGATRTVLLGGVFAVGWFARALAREGLRALERRLGDGKEARGEEASESALFFWMGAVIDAMVVLAMAPIAFVILGAAWSDVFGIVRDAFEGFVIPGTEVRVSFSKVIAAAIGFIVVFSITRFVQRTAETKLFPQTRMDVGLQNSLKTLIGYTGLIIAFMTGVSALGFDFSNLAIIAGALSVGIGFGLQSIVNNFVSGLILLFERPIKVGDWIVTGSGEGTVKRISVRSTEIETFDRSSIIVPNSELISSSVTNWTHKSAMGRVVVPVGVSYSEDPDRIIRILQEVGDKHPQALSYPKPFVYFVDFGASSLDFDLRVYIRDINNTLSVKRDLRIAIFKRFREEGVEIPFPQRDLHVRSADGLGSVFGGRGGADAEDGALPAPDAGAPAEQS